ncbi:MAG TPA: DUF177 domain-containing protein [Gemmatimonadaceae bacterium]|nr:DUF177 domain-containing protein [Gemmatimonadaceae bacterium]
MLSFDLRDLDRQAATVDGRLAADDPVWEEGDARPAGPVHATGRLSKAGNGRYYWSGHIAGTAALQCRRCLTEVSKDIHDDVHLLFVEEGDAEVGDDPDAFRLAPRALSVDLRPAVREQWLLAAPEFALCREDCKGLCPRCGADWNAGPCDCAPETDSRWDALRNARHASRRR